MSAKKRDDIKDYLYEGLIKSFDKICVGRTPLEGYSSPEDARFLALWRDEERFLVAVHADRGYKNRLGDFSQFMKVMAKQNVACVSVFDDKIFYQWDRGVFKVSREGTEAEKRRRIKLQGLERVLQPLGPIAYYKNRTKEIEVVRLTGGVIADYSQSENSYAREIVQKKELLTVMDPTIIGRYKDQFDLSKERQYKKDYLLTSFCISGWDEEDPEDEYEILPITW